MPNYKVGIEVNAETGNSAKQIGGVGGALDALEDSLEGGSAGAGGFASSLTGLLNPSTLAIGAVGALGAALVATGAHAMGLATEVENSTARMTTQLGLTSDEAADFEGIMRSIYENNYGESFTTISEDLVSAEQNFKRLGVSGREYGADLEELTVLAISFGDAFDVDVGESTNAAVTLMENFGLTATQAFDFLVAGQQRGLDTAGDFLDTIGEYSVQFSEGGASAGEFFSILESGLQGGMLGTDKAADAFKEFSIRILDQSDSTRWALEDLGISYEELKQGFADGSITQVQAMQTVIDKINEIEDPVERSKQGVRLFGTQWEDLTDTVITSIDLQRSSMEELEGAAADLEEQYKTGGAAGEAAMRKWDNALVDVGDSLNDLKAFILPGLTLLLEAVVIPKINELSDWIDEVVEGVRWLSELVGLLPATPDNPDASAQAVTTSSFGGAIPVAATAGASFGGGGTQIYQSFFIDRGDADVVTNAAEIGVSRAQRARGQ